MANLQVTILDHTGSRKTAVEMPDDVPMNRLIPALVQGLDLPLQQGGGQIVYRLDHRRVGRRLGENETLSSAGVQEDDVLMLLPELVAGRVRN